MKGHNKLTVLCALLLAQVVASAAVTNGFNFTQGLDRLLITYAGQPVATHVFRNEKILRPYFANLHTPGGIHVTRERPPAPGKDATDHNTIHPDCGSHSATSTVTISGATAPSSSNPDTEGNYELRILTPRSASNILLPKAGGLEGGSVGCRPYCYA